MAKYKAYPEYKDSGVEWLGEIPRHWEMLRHKYVAFFTKGKNPTNLLEQPLKNTLPYLSMECLRNNTTDKYALKSNDVRIALEGQPLIIWDGSNAGEFVKGKSGILSSTMAAAILIYPLYPQYYWYLCISIEPEMRKNATGMGIPHVNGEELKRISFGIPSLHEQRKIATFLDHETAKIDNLIEKQQQLIELLKEKRQAVISHAVTKGLNPDVPMKDSGVEWLGEIPENWQLKQICHLCTATGGGTPSKSNPKFWVGNIPWVSPKDMKVQYISDAEDHVSEDAIKQSSTKKIPIGSVLIVVRGMILAHSVPVAINTKVVTINQDMKALMPNENISCNYLHLVLMGLKRILLELTDNSAHGTKCLRTDLFEKMWIPLPSVQQQNTIVSDINEQSTKIDSLIHLQEEAKALLQERRTALISAAVTGKIDVRDWVAPGTSDIEAIEEATA